MVSCTQRRVMAGAFSFLTRFLRPGGAAKDYTLAENYAVLRDAVFTRKPDAIGVVDEAGPDGVWGVVMETGYPGVVATLVAVADGAVSLYFSNGGGIIGMGSQEGPQRAGRELLGLAPQVLKEFEATTQYPLPWGAHVRCYVLAPGDAATA